MGQMGRIGQRGRWGKGAVQSILQAREEKGPFTSLFEFLERIDLRLLNKRAAEALIAAGALDAFGHRAQLLAGLDVDAFCPRLSFF